MKEDNSEETEIKPLSELFKEYIFPCAAIALTLCAAVVCAVGKDYKKAVYWLAAAVLNITVTFWED